MNTAQRRYSSAAVFLHWLIALLIIGQIAGGLYMHRLPATTLKFELYQWHKSFGVTILALSVLRLGWRLTHRPPPLPDAMSRIEQFGARASHAGFYVLLFALPLVGWAMVSASPKDLPTVLFETVPFPHMPGLPQSESLEAAFMQTHKYLAYSAIALLFLHVAAALKHHFIKRDDVLTAMAPWIKPKSSS
ncbi:MAG: cytochrome b [Marinicaulis sp.]|nr:cytochrome b [Marinicaulis sp.]